MAVSPEPVHRVMVAVSATVPAAPRSRVAVSRPAWFEVTVTVTSADAPGASMTSPLVENADDPARAGVSVTSSVPVLLTVTPSVEVVPGRTVPKSRADVDAVTLAGVTAAGSTASVSVVVESAAVEVDSDVDPRGGSVPDVSGDGGVGPEVVSWEAVDVSIAGSLDPGSATGVESSAVGSVAVSDVAVSGSVEAVVVSGAGSDVVSGSGAGSVGSDVVVDVGAVSPSPAEAASVASALVVGSVSEVVDATSVRPTKAAIPEAIEWTIPVISFAWPVLDESADGAEPASSVSGVTDSAGSAGRTLRQKTRASSATADSSSGVGARCGVASASAAEAGTTLTTVDATSARDDTATVSR